ncbi:uncharacterized protein PV07_01018 [Cladophialophora immunda]|uniref:Uncharacterized protein n=1 Tax=Cladophialophora immunda TaxID=569365 RepID=A0A0D2A1G2_9EURO|nr:uncharacterized protein PV07_01018 [Cladophialophora immunda]KIW34226.1 hypothetical protein PV07_01018 [Cladophialophora immunda]
MSLFRYSYPPPKSREELWSRILEDHPVWAGVTGNDNRNQLAQGCYLFMCREEVDPAVLERDDTNRETRQLAWKFMVSSGGTAYFTGTRYPWDQLDNREVILHCVELVMAFICGCATETTGTLASIQIPPVSARHARQAGTQRPDRLHDAFFPPDPTMVDSACPSPEALHPLLLNHIAMHLARERERDNKSVFTATVLDQYTTPSIQRQDLALENLEQPEKVVKDVDPEYKRFSAQNDAAIAQARLRAGFSNLNLGDRPVSERVLYGQFDV